MSKTFQTNIIAAIALLLTSCGATTGAGGSDTGMGVYATGRMQTTTTWCPWVTASPTPSTYPPPKASRSYTTYLWRMPNDWQRQKPRASTTATA